MKQVYMEIDEVLVPTDLILAARSGSNSGKEALKGYCSGIKLYVHLLEGDDDMEKVSIRELQKLGVIKRVVIQ